MISVQDAESIIMSNLLEEKTEAVSIENSVGRVLKESITADRDFPPFDRVMMDGIAINFEEFEKGTRSFIIQELQPAGAPASALKKRKNCIEIMTGAVLSDNTDTVIRYEDVSIKENKGKKIAQIKIDDIKKGQNVHKKGKDRLEGHVLIESGRIISPAEVQVIASVGESIVQVAEPPKVAIISTGDELVDVDDTPEPHQIRKSNALGIQAALNEISIPSTLYHLTDDKELLKEKLEKILDENNVLILSGGVSKGKLDLIPAVLEELGVEKLFHRIKQRPGKPFWFGIKKDENKFVFAFPGNPVSSFLCYYRYFKPWIIKSMGGLPKPKRAVLMEDFHFDPNLTYFLQVRVSYENEQINVIPETGGGSGDLANLLRADAFLELPENSSYFKKGEVFNLFPYRFWI